MSVNLIFLEVLPHLRGCSELMARASSHYMSLSRLGAPCQSVSIDPSSNIPFMNYVQSIVSKGTWEVLTPIQVSARSALTDDIYHLTLSKKIPGIAHDN